MSAHMLSSNSHGPECVGGLQAGRRAGRRLGGQMYARAHVFERARARKRSRGRLACGACGGGRLAGGGALRAGLQGGQVQGARRMAPRGRKARPHAADSPRIAAGISSARAKLRRRSTAALRQGLAGGPAQVGNRRSCSQARSMPCAGRRAAETFRMRRRHCSGCRTGRPIVGRRSAKTRSASGGRFGKAKAQTRMHLRSAPACSCVFRPEVQTAFSPDLRRESAVGVERSVGQTPRHTQ